MVKDLDLLHDGKGHRELDITSVIKLYEAANP